MTDGFRASPPRTRRYGEQSWLVEFEGPLDLEVNERVQVLAARLGRLGLPGLEEVVPAAASLAVHVDAEVFDHAGFEAVLAASLEHGPAVGEARLHEIPVCYEPPFAPDLDHVAHASGCTVAEVIDRHVAAEYRVLMLGFLPGFPYLGLVDARIAAPRRATPRLVVPAGSVGIAGRQTGVYPVESPGGWQIVGRTPWRLFDPRRDPPARLAPGDRVRFVRVAAGTFDALAGEGW